VAATEWLPLKRAALASLGMDVLRDLGLGGGQPHGCPPVRLSNFSGLALRRAHASAGSAERLDYQLKKKIPRTLRDPTGKTPAWSSHELRDFVIPAIFKRESTAPPLGCPLGDCGHDGPKGTRRFMGSLPKGVFFVYRQSLARAGRRTVPAQNLRHMRLDSYGLQVTAECLRMVGCDGIRTPGGSSYVLLQGGQQCATSSS